MTQFSRIHQIISKIQNLRDKSSNEKILKYKITEFHVRAKIAMYNCRTLLLPKMLFKFSSILTISNIRQKVSGKFYEAFSLTFH